MALEVTAADVVDKSWAYFAFIAWGLIMLCAVLGRQIERQSEEDDRNGPDAPAVPA